MRTGTILRADMEDLNSRVRGALDAAKGGGKISHADVLRPIAKDEDDLERLAIWMETASRSAYLTGGPHLLMLMERLDYSVKDGGNPEIIIQAKLPEMSGEPADPAAHPAIQKLLVGFMNAMKVAVNECFPPSPEEMKKFRDVYRDKMEPETLKAFGLEEKK